jgi:hypothetical protein
VSPDPAVSAIAREQARLAEELAELRLTVKGLETEVQGEKSKGYKPKPSIPWWENLTEDEIRAYLGALKGWYEQIAIPCLGAPELPSCLYVHGLCRTVLDTASELWKSLWFPERRTPQLVSAQGEFLARLWPALLELLIRETTRCSHQRQAANGHVRSVVA